MECPTHDWFWSHVPHNITISKTICYSPVKLAKNVTVTQKKLGANWKLLEMFSMHSSLILDKIGQNRTGALSEIQDGVQDGIQNMICNISACRSLRNMILVSSITFVRSRNSFPAFLVLWKNKMVVKIQDGGQNGVQIKMFNISAWWSILSTICASSIIFFRSRNSFFTIIFFWINKMAVNI